VDFHGGTPPERTRLKIPVEKMVAGVSSQTANAGTQRTGDPDPAFSHTLTHKHTFSHTQT